ncbi:MAG: hypothetical protein NTV64_06915 [Polaromonas sp.]|nr:hypothetical protein [Polaromonas sp.]
MVTSAKPRVTRKTSAVKSAVSAKRAPSKAARAPVKSPAKPPLKTAAKTPVKAKLSPQAKTAVKTAVKPVKPVKPVKVEKAKKPKMIRDSFTIPKTEYVVIDALKERAGKLSRAAKKSELLRAGVKALAAMSDAAFLAALTAVPTIKTGRPAATS